MAQTPLHDAVSRTDQEAVVVLLHAGADPNAKDDRGRTPLHNAVLARQMSISTILLQYGADPKLQDAHGESALDMAGRRDDVGLIAVLAGEHSHKFV